MGLPAWSDRYCFVIDEDIINLIEVVREINTFSLLLQVQKLSIQMHHQCPNLTAAGFFNLGRNMILKVNKTHKPMA